MTKDGKRRIYNSIKEYNGQKYTGMKIGGKHRWNYKDGDWNETKIAPEKWKFEFICNKYRIHQAPVGTGALNNTKYHWYIIADQKVNKLDANTYRTEMTGIKYKVAHKRPHWNHWSYEYKRETYEDQIINILEEVLKTLKTKKENRELTKFF
ncbi:MAG: hypothetical protein ACFFFH_03625 [Candidatus Thorarchaeota archaeon]